MLLSVGMFLCTFATICNVWNGCLACMHVCILTQMCMYVCIDECAHKCMHAFTYTHRCMHACTYPFKQLWQNFTVLQCVAVCCNVLHVSIQTTLAIMYRKIAMALCKNRYRKIDVHTATMWIDWFAGKLRSDFAKIDVYWCVALLRCVGWFICGHMVFHVWIYYWCNVVYHCMDTLLVYHLWIHYILYILYAYIVWGYIVHHCMDTLLVYYLWIH